jgi:hypothetical protein
MQYQWDRIFHDKLAVPQPTQYKTHPLYTALRLVHSLLHLLSVKAEQNSCAFNVNFLQHQCAKYNIKIHISSWLLQYRDGHTSLSLLHLLPWG